jgi:hypothetical protein
MSTITKFPAPVPAQTKKVSFDAATRAAQRLIEERIDTFLAEGGDYGLFGEILAKYGVTERLDVDQVFRQIVVSVLIENIAHSIRVNVVDAGRKSPVAHRFY